MIIIIIIIMIIIIIIIIVIIIKRHYLFFSKGFSIYFAKKTKNTFLGKKDLKRK